MSAADEPNPTAARRELALHFRTLREQQERSLDDLANHLGVSEAHASRLDRGARGLSPEDVQKLAAWYGLPEAEQRRLLALATKGRKRDWWQREKLYGPYRTLIGMEQAAHSINEYNTSVVPGLLQTRAYALAAAAATTLGASDATVQQAVEVRMRRQEILSRERPPRLWTVIDECVLARGAGGPEVMREQLLHLIDVSRRPDIKVQVISFAYGAHPGGNGQFILLDTAGDVPDLVYSEGLHRRADSASNKDVEHYRRLWDSLRALALGFPESRALIEQYLRTYTPQPP